MAFESVLSEPKTLEEVEMEVQRELEDYDVKSCLKKAAGDGELETKCLGRGKVLLYIRKRTSARGSILGTPVGSRVRSLPFRSPAQLRGHLRTPATPQAIRTPSSCSASRSIAPVGLSPTLDLPKEIARLKKQLEEVNREVSELSGLYNEENLQLYIEKLHEYNDIKDAGQILMGKMAEVEGTTSVRLYKQYGLELDD